MDGFENSRPRPVTRRRRKRSQFEIFKETYLPLVIVCIAAVMILIFIIGSITRGIQRAKLENGGASSSQGVINDADAAINKAKALAAVFDYEGAIAAIDAYSGKPNSQMKSLREDYTAAMKELVTWEDNSKVTVLSFQQLIADSTRAFANGNYDDRLTTGEFTKILQKLYENDYILVRLDAIAEESTSAAGDVALKSKALNLPAGKKPLILVQTGVNYYTSLVDSDNDKFPDQNAPGFANRLLLDENGNLACELIDSDGATVTGAYDLVPILESFITTHPDFSYKGARAILAVTGFDGLFGYRSDAAAGEYFGPAYRDKQGQHAATIAAALQQSGYEIACNTYGDIAYGTVDAATLSADLESWNSEVASIVPNVDILVYAKDSDIAAANEPYSGEKFSSLNAQGFRYYIGNHNSGASWQVMGETYMRLGRLPVTANTIKNNGAWFNGMFDSSVLEAGR